MTMAPGRKKRGFWMEIIFVGILLFLLLGSRAQSARSSGTPTGFKQALHRSLAVQPVALK